MCGLSAVLDPQGTPGSGAALLRMHEPIRHRGPDGEGFLAVDGGLRATCTSGAVGVPPDARLGMAFRRLKVLDLSDAAAQPMGTPDGMLWIAFNGEIYNFRDLRRELSAQGRSFRSSGDSEVVLAAFERWGEAAFEKLEGMWAVVVADLRRRRLVASRDRFGIKPLYWAVDGERLLLASEAKQILRARRARPRCNPRLVALHLRGARLPSLEDTFFEGVHAVPPGTWFEAPLDAPVRAPAFRAYWDLSAFRCEDPRGFPLRYPDAARELEGRLAGAVASHAGADVALGALLSGGLDSSLLVSLLARDGADPGRPTFSFGYRDAPAALNELTFADALVRRRGLVNHETRFDAAWVAANAPAVVRALEEPPLALAALGQYRVFELCRARGVTVILDGQGADEIFGGYAYHQRTLLVDRLRRGRLLELARELRAIAERQGCGPADVLAALFAGPAVARLRARRPDWLDPVYGAAGASAALSRLDSSRDASALNRRLHADVKWGNAKIILGYADRNAMAHSVEARVPYFDRRLVEFAFSLPDDYKVGDGDRKRILREVGRAHLPAEITERPDRTGFAVPEERLMSAGVLAAARERVRDEGFLASPCLIARGARRLVDAPAPGETRALWRLYTLALWRSEFDVDLG